MQKLQRLLYNINPRNSLFGRIFIWFWFTISIMVVLAFITARFVNQSWQVSAIPEDQLMRAEVLQNGLQRQLDRELPLNRTLRRMSQRSRWNLMTIKHTNDEFSLGFPAPLMRQSSRLIALKESPTPLMIRTNSSEIYGPFPITFKNKEHSLFIGRLLRREEQPKFGFGWGLFVFLGVGIAACVGIAYTITTPIKKLSELSRGFAAGEAQEPNTDFIHRKDEIGKLHKDIVDMASDLAKSVAQQKALMANVSHELRTPLTRLQLALSMLNPQTEDQQHYAARIEKDIGIMDNLIGQALQLARMKDESQAQWLQHRVCRLSEVLNPIIADLQFEAKANACEIEINEFNDIDIALIENSFTSAIENVTRNAIKYANSVVKIHVMHQKDKQCNELLIVIEDDGKGLSEQEMNHILEPFYRAQSNRQENGVGLGLSIVKAAIELHNGKIQLSVSDLGGLKVQLSIPII